MKRISRAEYSYSILNLSGRDVVSIEDLNRGQMSVTNDIENVIREISETEKRDVSGMMIVYKDSEGNWDGWDANNYRFVFLGANDVGSAVSIYSELQLKRLPNAKD